MLSIDEIKRFIEEDHSSAKKRDARKGLEYYEADHDIRNYRLFYYDSDGKLVEDKTRSNIKIAHPFFTELVDQEVQYMLSGEKPFITSDDPELQAELDKYFDDDFEAELNETLTGAISKGFDYMYAYQNADDRLSFQNADGLGVVEVRAKDTDDETEYVIYWYVDRVDKGTKLIKRVQVWDTQQTTFYVMDDKGKLTKDESVEINPRPHVIYKKDGDAATYFEEFGYIPFFRLDNNRKQQSSLKPVKALIDDYDLMSCGLSNNLQDVAEGIYVVTGFQGDNLDELIQNVKVKKHIGVDADGGLDIKTIDVPYDARKTKLELDEKNIYRFGMGFNAAQVGDGNITNVVIKSRYALLDLKCNKLEIRLKQFLRKLIKAVLAEINERNETDYTERDVKIVFTREVMTNAQDNATIKRTDAETQQIRITTLLNVASVLDDETVVQGICDILDVDYDEIKDRLPENPEAELRGAMGALGAAEVTDDEL